MNAVLVPGGFGERGVEGKIAAVTYAREKSLPFLGICFGMQLACVEAARRMGLNGASSTEFGPCADPIVGLMTEWEKEGAVQRRGLGDNLGGTMRLGAYPCVLEPNSLVSAIYAGAEADQRAASASLRGQYQLQAAAGAGRAALLGHVPGRPSARDGRAAGRIPGSSACSSIPS